MAKVLINGEEYAWEDVSVNLFGSTLDGITAVDYTLDRKVEQFHGRGSQPLGLTRGKKTPAGSITVHQSVLEGIQRSLARGKDLTDIAPFDIPVSYAPESGIKTTDILKGCRFTKVPKKIDVDNPKMTVQLDLAIRQIGYNV